MQRVAKLTTSLPPLSLRRDIGVRFYAATKRPRRVEPRGQDLSARFRQLERTLRTKEALTDQLADTDHVRASTDLALNEEIQPMRRIVKPARTFHGLIIPDKPSEPEADECCMSGCAVCVYDLYDESMQSYKDSLASIRASLVKINIPENDWPSDIRTLSSSSSDSSREKSVTLSAFEEMERQLAEKRAHKATNAASASEEGVGLLQPERERALARRDELERVNLMREKKARVTLRDIYEALQWITFSNR